MVVGAVETTTPQEAVVATELTVVALMVSIGPMMVVVSGLAMTMGLLVGMQVNIGRMMVATAVKVLAIGMTIGRALVTKATEDNVATCSSNQSAHDSFCLFVLRAYVATTRGDWLDWGRQMEGE